MSGTVVVLSGGMDSATLLATDPHVVSAVSIDYGQRHQRELEAARQLALHYGVPWCLVDLRTLGTVLGGSSQTDEAIAVPHGHYADDSMRVTVVPNRNMVLLAVAIGHAIAVGADVVAYGAHAGDHAVYPDCRPEFAEAMDAVARLCHYAPGIRLARPFIMLTKADIVRAGTARAVPYHLTWSCYEGGDQHCGRCGTCVERREAFAVAGVADPTGYTT